MINNLTLDWIISTLKKSGINSKQIVIDRLEKASDDELDELSCSIFKESVRRRSIEKKTS